MPETNDMNEVEWREHVRDQLLDVAESEKYGGAGPMVRHLDGEDTDEVRAFLEVSFEKIIDELAKNHAISDRTFGSGTSPENYHRVGQVFDADNVDDIDVRQNGWHSPTVRIWLSDCPAWANAAWNSEFKFATHESQPHYNGNSSHAILDVRPV